MITELDIQKPLSLLTAKPRLQVLYVRKHKHIELIGGRNPDYSLWTMTQTEAIDEIKSGRLELFVHKDDKVVPVIVSTGEGGDEYLRTASDGIVPDNLLSLPEPPTNLTGKPRLQVLYVRKHDHIELIGGRNPDQSLWTMTRTEAIHEIESGKLELFVHKDSVPVIVSVSEAGNEYLRTERDGVMPDKLLSLPDLPLTTVTRKPHAVLADKTRLQILYILKPEDRTSRYDHIELIGGRNPDYSLWTMTQREAIDGIKSGKLEFFVHKDSVPVIVSVSEKGNKYLRTERDGVKPDKLLSLPDVP